MFPNMLSRFPIYAAVAALVLSLQPVQAGPGADVFACLSIADPAPSFPLNVTFTIPKGSTHCMSKKGHSATLTITSSGLSCTAIGYVEAKRSGLCTFGASLWGLAFETSNRTAAGGDGMMRSKWRSETVSVGVVGGRRGRGKKNVMTFKSADVDVMACPRQEVCGSRKLSGEPGIAWEAGTRGPVYVIFKSK